MKPSPVQLPTSTPLPSSAANFRSPQVLSLTKENLFEHEKRYSSQEVSSTRISPKAEPEKKSRGREENFERYSQVPTKLVLEDDCASEATLVDNDSASCKSTRVAYAFDNASVTSRLTTTTLSSLQSTEDRQFREGLAQLEAHIRHVQQRQFSKMAPYPSLRLRETCLS